VKRNRDEWRAAQPPLEPARLAFVDGTAAATNRTRRYGRASAGGRLVDPTPFRHWKVTTFVSALR
jgi:hypothetical protein